MLLLVFRLSWLHSQAPSLKIPLQTFFLRIHLPQSPRIRFSLPTDYIFPKLTPLTTHGTFATPTSTIPTTAATTDGTLVPPHNVHTITLPVLDTLAIRTYTGSAQDTVHKTIFPYDRFLELPAELRNAVYRYAVNFNGVQSYFDKVASLTRLELAEAYTESPMGEDMEFKNPRLPHEFLLVDRVTRNEALAIHYEMALIIERPLPYLQLVQRRHIIDCALPKVVRLNIGHIHFRIPDAWPFQQLQANQAHLPSYWSFLFRFFNQAFYPAIIGSTMLKTITFEFDPGPSEIEQANVENSSEGADSDGKDLVQTEEAQTTNDSEDSGSLEDSVDPVDSVDLEDSEGSADSEDCDEMDEELAIGWIFSYTRKDNF
ncbi:hypothetical protein EJ08DRAFT_660539 [Tothia fuscella]|uniref:F-box domain-containing protein n=1 Tax=Tothia fuscella TaxID=1048955 RepID=A0A9P4TYN8_9PEZI|nr:hypothetical protein EJ08DRAFT_660539 [Tothia fuscella]